MKASVSALGIAVVGAFLGAPPTISATQGDSFDLEGTISQQSPGKLTVDSGQGILFHVVYDEKTAIVGPDGKPGTAQDFKVGLRVHVLGNFDDSGAVKARRIEIQASAPRNSSQPPPQT